MWTKHPQNASRIPHGDLDVPLRGEARAGIGTLAFEEGTTHRIVLNAFVKQFIKTVMKQ
jgi:hypothetical protein